jgi:hypothetical protein
MTLIMMYDGTYANSCPHCRAPDSGVSAITQRCACGTAYTRAKDCTDCVIMLPSHSSVLTDLASEDTDPSAYVASDDASGCSNDEHMDDSARCGDYVVPFYDDVNAKNVDFSTPPKVLVTDLLGFFYFVPWRHVSTVDGLTFFLQYFPAGGSVLTWQDDYRVVDDTEFEITRENWSEVGYPGISLKLCPCRREAGHNLCQTIISKIEAECLTRLSKTPEVGIDSLISHLCLAIGAFDSQRQLRQLIVDTTTALCLDNNRAVLVNSARPVTVNQHWPCLICPKQFSTTTGLAKHVQSHLAALRCPGPCVSCEESDLPYFMGEVVSERDSGCEDSTAVSDSI